MSDFENCQTRDSPHIQFLGVAPIDDQFSSKMSQRSSRGRVFQRTVMTGKCSCLIWHFPRITELTFAVRQSTSFGMIMYLIRVNQFATIRDYPFLFKNQGVFFAYLRLITVSTARICCVSKLLQKRIYVRGNLVSDILFPIQKLLFSAQSHQTE
jgi:hypothetical protein